MSTHRDDELGTALRKLPVPDHHGDFWDQLDHRLAGEPAVGEMAGRRDRRLRVPRLWMLSAAAAVALIVALVVVVDDSPKTQVRVVTPPTTAPGTAPTSTTTPDGPITPTTTAPAPGASEFVGIYPVTTQDELERELQRREDGEDGLPIDRDSVVRQYLSDHGVSDPTLEPFESGEVAAVRYAAGTQSGTVRAQRVAGGAYVVTSATTELIQTVSFERRGTRLDVTVEPGSAGRLTAKAGPFRSEFTVEQTAQATPGTPSELRLTLPHATDPALLRVEIDAGAGARGFAEARIVTEVRAAAGPALAGGSTLAADRLGPVPLGLSFALARQATGVAMTESLGAYCDVLTADSAPGISFVRTVSDSGIALIAVDRGRPGPPKASASVARRTRWSVPTAARATARPPAPPRSGSSTSDRRARPAPGCASPSSTAGWLPCTPAPASWPTRSAPERRRQPMPVTRRR